jgi:glucosamine--fructose-6-phosphate aminotransferase (isomerizing)
MSKSPFEIDIDGQADALRAFALSPLHPELPRTVSEPFERIVLTGMGSSHSAALPTWRALVSKGHPTWWVDTGQLLDTPQLVTPDTLLVATSQSGASGEIIALFDAGAAVTPRAVIGITNDPTSPLAARSDVVIELHSGNEATVSTKSYLNSLAAHQRLLATLTQEPSPSATPDAAKAVECFDPGPDLARLAQHLVAATEPRVAYVGNRDHAATALYAGLITKEAAKIAAEGYIGGQFRHGPFELAGAGLLAVLFGAYAEDPNPSLRHLAADLVEAGSNVLVVGDLTLPGATTLTAPATDTFTDLAIGALVAQHLAVEIAKARGIEPGAFVHGSKVTTTR